MKNNNKKKKVSSLLSQTMNEGFNTKDDCLVLCQENHHPSKQIIIQTSKGANLSMKSSTNLNSKVARRSKCNLSPNIQKQSDIKKTTMNISPNLYNKSKRLYNKIKYAELIQKKYVNTSNSSNSNYRNVNKEEETVKEINEAFIQEAPKLSQDSLSKYTNISLRKYSNRNHITIKNTLSESTRKKEEWNRGRFNISALKKTANIANESYVDNHLRKSNLIKSRNIRRLDQFNSSNKNNARSSNTRVNYEIKVINNLNNYFNIRENNHSSSRNIKHSFHDSVIQSNELEELHFIFVSFLQQKNLVYKCISEQFNEEY